MPPAPLHFPEITLLVTHYNRSQSLERLLRAFEALGLQFGVIVVADDGSQPAHQQALQHLQATYDFQLVGTPQNRGLGYNINQGQAAVRTPYTLYVQEDFEPQPAFRGALGAALGYLQADAGLDIARFYAYFSYPYTKPYGQGFAEMVFRPQLWANNHLKFYVYSDHPHLRRTSFPQKFGRYQEGVKGDVTEANMAKAFIRQGGRGIFFEDFNGLFHQKNSSTEPSTMHRASWRASTNPLALSLRFLYLQGKLLRWTYDIR